MTSAHDFERQADWEMEGTRRAVARYRELEYGIDGKPPKDAALLPPGRALMKGVVKPLIAAITARQAELAAALSSAGRQPLDAWPLQVVCPEKAAVITLMTATRAVGGRMESNGLGTASVINIAESIAGAIKDQLQYDQWCETEREANKVTSPKVDRLKALSLTYPNLDRRCWSKWARKLDIAALGDWDKATAITMGSNLLSLLVLVAPDRFTIEARKAFAGVKYILKTTPEVRAIMCDVRERAEVCRPTLMPMLIPPLPWVYAA